MCELMKNGCQNNTRTLTVRRALQAQNNTLSLFLNTICRQVRQVRNCQAQAFNCEILLLPQKKIMKTVKKFKNFTASQILREIKIWQCKGLKQLIKKKKNEQKQKNFVKSICNQKVYMYVCRYLERNRTISYNYLTCKKKKKFE